MRSLKHTMAPNWVHCPRAAVFFLFFVFFTNDLIEKRSNKRGISRSHWMQLFWKLLTSQEKVDKCEYSSLHISPNLRDQFRVETDKAWSLSCCSACFGVEAKLVATESEVPRQHAPSMLGPPFVIIQFVCTVFYKQEVPKTSGGPGKDVSPPTGS